MWRPGRRAITAKLGGVIESGLTTLTVTAGDAGVDRGDAGDPDRLRRGYAAVHGDGDVIPTGARRT